jgi:hypothetical protein
MQTIDPKKLKDLGLPKEVEEVYLYLKAYAEPPERKEWEKRYDQAWRVVENDIWEEDEKTQMEEQKQIPLCVNDAVKGMQASCAVQTSQKPEIKFYPVGKGDVYVAELLKRAHDLVWEKNEGGLNIYEWCEERDVGAIGFIRARIDPNKGPFGKIVNETLDPRSVYWDKNSKKRDFSDTHLIIANLRSKSYIKEQYDDIKDDDLFYHEAVVGGGKSSGVTGGDNYAIPDKDKKPDSVDEATEPENIWEIEASIRKVRAENWIIYQDQNGKIQTAKVEAKDKEGAEAMVPAGGRFVNYWPRKREIREVRIIVGKKLVQKLEDPYGEDSDGDPIVHIIGLRAQRTRNAFPMSPMNYSRDILRLKNKALMRFDHAAAHNTNSPILEAEGAVRWTGAPGTPGSRAYVDLNKVSSLASGVSRLPPGASQSERHLELVAAAEKAIADQFDAPPVVKGEIPQGADPSGRTVLALQDMASTVSKPKIGSLEGSLVRLAKVNTVLELQKWPREFWERLLEEDEWTSWIPEKEKSQLLAGDQEQTGAPPGEMPELTDETKKVIKERWEQALELIRPADYSKPPGINLIDVDVKIVAGSSMPTNRIAREQVAMEKFKVGLYDRKAALEYSDDPKSEEIALRMDQAEKAAMQAEAMKKAGVG